MNLMNQYLLLYKKDKSYEHLKFRRVACVKIDSGKNNLHALLNFKCL